MAILRTGLTKHEEESAKRFEERTKARSEKSKNLKTLGKGGDWRKVDEPARILNRLLRMGLGSVASEAMASLDARESATGSVPTVDVLERIIGADDTHGSAFLFDGACAARAVGRVIIRSAGGMVKGYGTGFMISPRLLMTNNHVLPSKADAANCTVQWNYYSLRDGNMAIAFESKLQPNIFWVTNAALDFTIIAVDVNGGQSPGFRGWLPLEAESGKVVVGEPVNIIQHPEGGPQKIALRANKVLDVFDNFIHYEADTNPGASGSPVLNDQWQLAALHHAGVPKQQANGTITWVANEGIRISKIVTQLKADRNSLPSSQQQLLDDALSARRPTECKCNGSGNHAATHGGGTTGESQPTKVDDDGNATWVIPMRVTVNVGGCPERQTPRVPQGTDSPSPADHQVKDNRPSYMADSPAYQRSIAALRRAESSNYYDAEQDQSDANDYYADIEIEASARVVYKSLSKLVTDTHTNVLSYNSARLEHLYPWVDLQESRKLHSVYSNKPVDAESVIRAECDLLLKREAMIREFVAREADVSAEAIEDYLDALEASEPFNCEHVVPQSWFNKKNPMRGDLHHLFTCEPDCNSFRGNIPFFQFEDEAIREDCGRRENGKFEPKANKGAVARATLYFLLRYPGVIGNAPGEFQPSRLPILMTWHEQFPVNIWERHRNAAIFAAQGNRNPLIDRPDWAVAIDFKHGFGA